MSPPSPEAQVRFLSQLQRLLSDGGRSASYKYALLLAIADISVEKGDDSGAPLRISTRELAERFIRYYWRQAVPYAPLGGEGVVLKQNTDRQAAVVNAVVEAHAVFEGSLAAATRDRRAWKKLVTRVASVVKGMPLWRLQTIGGEPDEFLYDNDFVAPGVIELKPGVAYCFRRFHGLVGNLVRGAWLRFVRGIKGNRNSLGDAQDLAEFMFGSERADLSLVRPVLREVQSGICFYCHKPLKSGGEVDHFVPWSRYPIDLGHNFVLAHGRCNGTKSDRLAAVPHLEAWCQHNEEHGRILVPFFDEHDLVHDLPGSRRVARGAYEQAEVSMSKVWIRGDEMVDLAPGWRTLLAAG